MKIEQYRSPLLSSNMYVISNGGEAIVIDPYKAEYVFDHLDEQGVEISNVLLTHEHYDHISGVNWLRDRYNCPVWCSEKCAANIQDPRMNFSRFFEAFCEIQAWASVSEENKKIDSYECRASSVFSGEKELNWQGHSIKMHETPGHSQGSSCYLFDGKYLFCGDALFKDFPTELRFLGSSKDDMNKITFPYLRLLSKDVLVQPGHFEAFYLRDYKFWPQEK